MALLASSSETNLLMLLGELRGEQKKARREE